MSVATSFGERNRAARHNAAPNQSRMRRTRRPATPLAEITDYRPTARVQHTRPSSDRFCLCVVTHPPQGRGFCRAISPAGIGASTTARHPERRSRITSSSRLQIKCGCSGTSGFKTVQFVELPRKIVVGHFWHPQAALIGSSITMCLRHATGRAAGAAESRWLDRWTYQIDDNRASRHETYARSGGVNRQTKQSLSVGTRGGGTVGCQSL